MSSQIVLCLSVLPKVQTIDRIQIFLFHTTATLFVVCSQIPGRLPCYCSVVSTNCHCRSILMDYNPLIFTQGKRIFTGSKSLEECHFCGMCLRDSRQSLDPKSLIQDCFISIKLVTPWGQRCGEVTWLCLRVVVGLATLVRLYIKKWNGKGTIFFTGLSSESESIKRYTQTLCDGWVSSNWIFHTTQTCSYI